MTGRVTLRIGEVAERLGVGSSTVQRWVATGRLPHVRVGGVVLIRPDALDAFLTAHTEGDDLSPRRGARRRTPIAGPA